MALSYSKLFASSTAMALIMSNAAYADVTAEDVWAQLQEISGLYGRTLVVGSKSYTGGKMVLSDVAVSAKVEGAEREGSIEMIELQERGDGSVAISVSPEIKINTSSEVEDGGEFSAAIVLRQTGLSLVASGDPDKITYDLGADELAVSVEDLSVEDEDVPADISFVASGVKGLYSFETGDMINSETQTTIDTADFDVGVDQDTDGEKFIMKMKGSVADMTSTSVNVFPKDIDLADSAAMFGADVSVVSKATFGPANYTMDFDAEGDSVAVKGSNDKSTLDVAIKDGTVQYGGTGSGTKFEIEGSQIPLPDMTFSMADSAFNLMFPMAQSDEPKDFSFLTKLVDLKISDSLWSMIDASGALPHDPATLIVDLAGKANWLVDIMDPNFATEMSSEMPVELHALTVNEIKLDVAGAEVNGTGDFTFDNTDLASYDGMPAPTGKLNLNLFGINGLLDNLAAAGLLPQDQSMGARMMLGLFTRPGTGEDTLTSEIEFKDKGSIFANGQQLK